MRWSVLLLALSGAVSAAPPVHFQGPLYVDLDNRYYLVEPVDPVAGDPATLIHSGPEFGRYLIGYTAAANCRHSTTGQPVVRTFPAFTIGDGNVVRHLSVPAASGVWPAVTRDREDGAWVLHVASATGDVACDGEVAPPSQPWDFDVFRGGFEEREQGFLFD